MKNINQNKNGNVIANMLKASFAMAVCVFFAACGGDSVVDGLVKEEKAVSKVDSYEKLPDCNEKNDGASFDVRDEQKTYVCDDGEWVEDEEKESVKESEKSSSSKSGKKSDKDDSDQDDDSGKKESKDSDGKSSAALEDDDVESSSSSEKKGDSPKSSSAKSEELKAGPVTDSRDGTVYKTVKIGNQVWFAENLNYDDGHAVCPMEESENCKKYGRLYHFLDNGIEGASSLGTVCPDGWHVPDSLEFAELISYVSANNGDESVGVSLKAMNGWYAEGESVLIEGDGTPYGSADSTRVGATRGTDRFGFSALPAGSCWESGACYVGDDTRFYMMSGEFGSSVKLAFDKDNIMFDHDGIYGFISVRCLKNRSLKLDAMPSTIVNDNLLWMAEDLTSGGRSEFSFNEALTICPEGWRLPTEQEFLGALVNRLGIFPEEETEYFIDDDHFAIRVECSTKELCMWSLISSRANDKKHVRCVSEE